MEKSKGQLLSSPIQLTKGQDSGMVHKISLRATNKEKLIDLTTRLVLEKAVTHKEFTTTDKNFHLSVFELEERSVVFDLVKDLDDDISWNYELVTSTAASHNSKDTNNAKPNHEGNQYAQQQQDQQTKSPYMEKSGMYQFPAKPTFKSLPSSPPTRHNSNGSTVTPRYIGPAASSSSESSHDHSSTNQSKETPVNKPTTTPRTIDSKNLDFNPRRHHSAEPQRGTHDNRSNTTPRTTDSVISHHHHSTDLSNRIDSVIRPSSPYHYPRDPSTKRIRIPDETQRSTMEGHILSRANGHNKRKSVHLSEQDHDRTKVHKESTSQQNTSATNETSSQQPIPIERKEVTSIPVSRVQYNQNIVIKPPEQEPTRIGEDWMFYYKILLVRNEPHSQTSGPIYLHIHGYTFRVLLEVAALKCKVTVYYEGCSNVIVSVMKIALTVISALPGQETQCVPSKNPDKHATISPETPRHDQMGSFEFPMVWKLREKRLFYVLMKIS